MTDAAQTLDIVFNPPEEDWVSMHPNFVKSLRIGLIPGYGFLLLLTAGLYFLPSPYHWIGPVVTGLVVLLIIWRFFRMKKIATSWGYAERADDLFIRHGVWVRYLHVVPYGRMQMVEVTSGPIDRMLGLATVQLVTASSASNAIIRGLDARSAADLRDRLTSKGESQAAGL